MPYLKIILKKHHCMFVQAGCKAQNSRICWFWDEKNEFSLDFREVFCYNTGSGAGILKKPTRCTAASDVFFVR